MRRWIAGAAAGLGLLLAAPVARADGPQWNGSRITTQASVASESFVISASFVRSQNLAGGTMTDITTSFTIPSGLPPQCGAPGTASVDTDWNGNVDEQPWLSTAAHSVECNGTYSFEVVATFKPGLQPADVKRLPGAITVAAPPPDVTGVGYELQGGSVVLTWSAVSNKPPDFIGYRIERQDASGKYTTIGTAGPSSTTFTDTSPPPEGGEVVYRVVALRSGPNGAIASEGGGRKTVPVPAATTTTVPGATDGGATDGGTEGTGGTAGADGGATTGGTEGGTTGGARSTPRFDTNRGRTGVGTRAPRLNIGSGSGSGLLLEPPDAGFETEIDYGELPGDEESAGDELEIFDETSGRGLAVPIGIGAVLAGWGLHLFFLARAARPATIAVPVLDDAYDPYDPAEDVYDDPYGTSAGGYGSSSTYGTTYGSTYGGTHSYQSRYSDEN